MSVSTEAVIVIGYTYNQIENSLKEGTEEFIEGEELRFFPPYYDAPWEDSVFGVEVVNSGEGSFTDVRDEWVLKMLIQEAKSSLYKIVKGTPLEWADAGVFLLAVKY